MAAITKRLLHLRPNFHSYARPQPYPLYHFSSSSDPDAHSDDPQPDPNSDAQTRPSLSSVKSSIQQQPPPQNRNVFPRIPSLSTAGSTDNIHRQLLEFRVRSAAPPPPSSPGFSLQQLYEKNVNAKSGDSADSSGISSVGKHSFDHIGASLLRPNPGAQNGSGGKVSDRWSRFNASKVSKPFTWGRTNDLHKELGEKLKALRPQNRKGKWFSLQELSDRLAKMKQTEEKERNLMNDYKSVTSIRDGILGTALQKQGKAPMKNLGLLGSIVGTESHLLLPPKENLVEKLFHPDNMSSAEKIKLELKKVRDEFKMSESDCGSARVQVAQLTTKIKHLSTVLRKKDKHSRKGLQAMVQRRKKLLKYLRRTDWDSYCLVLSKLGLRDNPDVKA